tara:strand:- start:5734 stop:6762 length:1029 start_codon:yes stop_codon:yes gene_type:complete
MIAIHHSNKTDTRDSFSSRWILYCESRKLSFILVDCYDNKILEKLRGVSVLLWHAYLRDNGSFLFATNLIRAIEKLGIKCYPNLPTYITYDNKIAQKYLFEALDIPHIPTQIYYDKNSALTAVKSAEYPFIFKLSSGAGSNNVIMVKDLRHAEKLVEKVFGKGMPSINRRAIINDRLKLLKQRRSLNNLWSLLGSIARLIFPSKLEKSSPRISGYFYMQKFLENNKWDTRLIVIGNKCFAVRRNCREGDFRASGSGNPSYNIDNFPNEMIKIAFLCAKKLAMQSVAFDLIKDNDQYVIIEISYCFVLGDFYDDCHGFWTENLEFHKQKVDPQKFIIEDLIGS